MNEREAIERALQAEQRMLQRQQLLKRLWRLNQAEKSVESSSVANAPTVGEITKPRDAAKRVFRHTPGVA